MSMILQSLREEYMRYPKYDYEFALLKIEKYFLGRENEVMENEHDSDHDDIQNDEKVDQNVLLEKLWKRLASL